MVERDKESKTKQKMPRIVAQSIPGNLPFDAIFLPENERDKFALREMLQTIAEPYAPMEDARIRVIDIQRSISRGPHWDRFISEKLELLNNKVSNLQEKIEGISEALQDTLKIYNATIYELNNPKYRITTPIQILIIDDDEDIVARMPELNIYASGDTDTEAIYELKQEIIRLYEDLNNSENKLGPLPESWLNTLNKLIVVTDG